MEGFRVSGFKVHRNLEWPMEQVNARWRSRMNRTSSKKHLVESRSHMTSNYTWGPVTTLHDVGGVWDGLWTIIVTARGSCVTWPFHIPPRFEAALGPRVLTCNLCVPIPKPPNRHSLDLLVGHLPQGTYLTYKLTFGSVCSVPRSRRLQRLTAPMHGETWPLVADEPVNLKYFTTLGKSRIIWEEFMKPASQISDPDSFLGIIIGWDPSVCNSNRLVHVDILRFSLLLSWQGHIL